MLNRVIIEEANLVDSACSKPYKDQNTQAPIMFFIPHFNNASYSESEATNLGLLGHLLLSWA